MTSKACLQSAHLLSLGYGETIGELAPGFAACFAPKPPPQAKPDILVPSSDARSP